MLSKCSIEMRAETRAIDLHVEYSLMLSDFKQNTNVLANFSKPPPGQPVRCVTKMHSAVLGMANGEQIHNVHVHVNTHIYIYIYIYIYILQNRMYLLHSPSPILKE